ncbi:hypothetical protein [Methylocystis echinoides]|uniref:hypothetical protein n=1 Tax=Methylocystis echinoides TaxID=29468 RepID=UPI0034411883
MAERLDMPDVVLRVGRVLQKARALNLIADELAANHLDEAEAQALDWVTREILNDVRNLYEDLAAHLRADKQPFSTAALDEQEAEQNPRKPRAGA